MRRAAWEARARRRLITHSTRTPDGCIVWQRATDRDGYGVTSGQGRRQLRAHRLSYELLVGPIPEGMTLDHLCKNRACINVDHLEPVTAGTNTLRGDAPSIVLHRENRCAQGHSYTPENTYVRRDGARTCRTCMRGYKAAFNARRAGLA